MSTVVDLRGKKPKAPARPPVRRANTRSRAQSPARVHRFKMHGLKLGIVAVLAVGAFWSVSEASYLPALRLTSIEVRGTQALSPKAVQAAAAAVVYDGSWMFAPDDVFVLDAGKIERTIVQFPRVASVDVSRSSLLSQVEIITVVEREPYARWCDGTDCYLMDAGGFVFAHDAGETPAVSAVFSGDIATSSPVIGQTYEAAHIAELGSVVSRFTDAGHTPLGIMVLDDTDYRIVLDGFDVKATFGSDPVALARNLELALQSDALSASTSSIEYVDLRFGNRIYFKLGGSHAVR